MWIISQYQPVTLQIAFLAYRHIPSLWTGLLVISSGCFILLIIGTCKFMFCYTREPYSCSTYIYNLLPNLQFAPPTSSGNDIIEGYKGLTQAQCPWCPEAITNTISQTLFARWHSIYRPAVVNCSNQVLGQAPVIQCWFS